MVDRNEESSPQLKKSRTITGDEATPIFPGPLFPAVRRNASDQRDFSERDWVFPSFVLPQNPSKRSSSNKHRASSSSDASVTSPQLAAAAESKKIKLVTPSELTRPSSRTRTRDLKPFSLLLFLLTFICILSVPYAVYLRQRVAKLEEICMDKNISTYGNIEASLSDNNPTILSFPNAERRTVVLYSVVFTLAMPIVLYKHLDYFSHLTSLSRKKNNKEEVPLKKRIAYMVDVCFSVYPYAKLLALLFATILLIGFGGLALYAVNKNSFAEALWLSWTFVADSGNHADTEGIGPRIVSVSISSGGMLIFAMMLGLVSDAISEKVDSLRKGKSEVIERNHILILGWSDKLGSLLKQLAIANKSVGGGVVVVLAERDKEEMEIDIAKLEFDFMGTSVICRSGSPLIFADLKKVSVSKARAIIVLASDENADQSDARALRVVLSLTGVKEGLRGHVVVEMSDLDNEPLVKLVGGELIETVVAHDVIGRLMIQCALQPGLAQVLLLSILLKGPGNRRND